MNTTTTSSKSIESSDLERLAHLEERYAHFAAFPQGTLHRRTASRLRHDADHLRREIREGMAHNGLRPSLETPCPICSWTGGRVYERKCVWCQQEAK